MSDFIYVILICIFIYFVFIMQRKESFSNTNVINPNISYNEYKHLKKINYPVKEDVYMNFMGDLNQSFNKYLKEVSKDSNSPIKQKALCDDRIRIKVQTDAVKDAFKKVPQKDIDKESELFDKNIPKSSTSDFKINLPETLSFEGNT